MLLRVRVPIADKVESSLKELGYFLSLCIPVGNVCQARSTVCSARAGCHFHDNLPFTEPSEQLASGFRLPPPTLPPSTEMLYDVSCEDERLAGAADGKTK